MLQQYGTVYSWETLEPLPKTIIVVNTTPEQRIVSGDGSYSINLTPGCYTLIASYYKNGNLELYTEMNLTVEKDGNYNLDLVLFPPISDFNFEEPE
ncbi:MAG TPA: MarR family transcriptional regulator, partial [Archaeoglobaceae archaeon]|nr:MarR family transcriptional regulator [Archaeoglobaceae archaeon]